MLSLLQGFKIQQYFGLYASKFYKFYFTLKASILSLLLFQKNTNLIISYSNSYHVKVNNFELNQFKIKSLNSEIVEN